MKTATVTHFRQKMKEHLNEIQNDKDILILTGPRKMDFVILTLEAYNAMEETAHLLSTPKNTERLMESIAQDRAGNAFVRKLDQEKIEQGAKRKSPRKSTKQPAPKRKR
jgi:antitoxin YefM